MAGLGIVLDPSNAVVANATVTVKNERTGAIRTATTDAGGRYVVTGLAPSTYTLSVKVGNFAPLEYTGLHLVASQEFALDLSLQAAGVSEMVTVVGTAAPSTSARRASGSMSANAK
jgi:iron complex outermembrane receptor protein